MNNDLFYWCVISGNIDSGQGCVGMKIQTLFISRLTVAKTGVLF